MKHFPPPSSRPSIRAMVAEQGAAQPDRMPWPDGWFDQHDPGEIAACRALWGAALTACICTALGIDSKYDRRKDRYFGIALSSSWFYTTDFHTMCALAGLDGRACAERLTDPARLPEIKRLLLSKNAHQIGRALK